MIIQEKHTFPFLKEDLPKNRMLCLHNACGISGSFPDYTIFISKLKTNECAFIHETI